jgi:hypothetical protein
VSDGVLFEGRVDGLPMPVLVHEDGSVGGGSLSNTETHYRTMMHLARRVVELEAAAAEYMAAVKEVPARLRCGAWLRVPTSAARRGNGREVRRRGHPRGPAAAAEGGRVMGDAKVKLSREPGRARLRDPGVPGVAAEGWF